MHVFESYQKKLLFANPLPFQVSELHLCHSAEASSLGSIFAVTLQL